MSTTIDQRVVEMRFDNKQFESATKESMSTLQRLKDSLNLTGASKGLESIDSAARKVNMSGLGSAIETVHAKFSALEVMGVTALANITNSAVNAGKKMVSALTIDPIKTGFSEYETQINAVQTILSNTRSKGTTLDDVNGALDELNTYADKTIYNFTEMTRNIGTFTAAGVDLDTSVSSIQGIANLAAVSGSTSQQASTAMYQLSQALSSGTVKLQDWNSVVNAGMGGQLFQDALKRTATNMGYNVDEMIKKYGSFRESLTQGEWLTSEVLTETLTQLSGAYSEADLIAKGYTKEQAKEIMALAEDAENAATKVKTFTQLWDTLKEAAQSGWTQSWEIIVGDFEEARELLTKVSDTIGAMIGASAKSRNDLLQGWKDGGGRTDLIDGIANGFEAIMNIISPIKEAFREIFPPLTVKQLLSFTEGFKNLTERFKNFTEEQAPNIKSTFKGVFAILDIGVTFVKEVAGGIGKLIGSFKGLGGSILGVSGSFGDWATGLRDSIKETDVFGTAVNFVVDFLQKAIDKVKEFGGFLKEKFVLPGFEGFLEILGSIWDVMQKVGGKIAEIGSSIGEALANAFRSGDISSGLDIINGGLFAGLLISIKKFVSNIGDAFGDGGFLDGVKDILDGVKGSLEAWQKNLQAGTLLKIASAIGILAAAIVVLAMIDPGKLSASLGAITVLFGDLVGSMALLGKIGDLGGVAKIIATMIGMSVSVLILASALKKIASLKFGELVVGLGGVLGLTAILVAAAKVMSSDGKTIVKGAGQMILMAIALKVLASACEDLSALSWEGLAKGLSGVVVLMFMLTQSTKSLSGGSKGLISAGIGMIAIAAGMKILASACKDFASLSWEELAKGLSSSVIMIFMLSKSANSLSGSEGLIKAGIGVIAFAAGIKVLASAITDMATLSWMEIAKGLSTLAVSLILITGTISKMPGNMVSTGVGLVVVSSALLILAKAVGNMAGMTWDEIGRGMVVLGGSMLILAVGMNAMNGTLAGSAALLIAAAALTVLVPVLTTLGAMSWGEIGKGLLTIAGAFTVLGIAGYLLAPLVPTILSLSAAIALFGVACVAIGAGISLISVGLTALATAVSGGATAIVAGLTIIITGIAGLIPVIVQRLGEAIILLCQVIAEGAPAIGEAVKAIVLTLVNVLVECVPAIADGALQLISGVLAALAEYTPQIVDSLFQFLIGLLDGIAANLPTLIQSAVNLLMSFLQGIVDALQGLDTTALLEGVVAIGLLSGLMIALSAVAALIPGAMVGVLGIGLVIAELALVLAAVGALAQLPGLSWLIGEGGQLLQSIGTAIGQFAGGIVGGFATGVSSQFPQIGSDLAAFMTNVKPFIDGAKSLDASMLDGVKALAEVILILTAADILEGLTSWITGGSSLADFGAQLVPFGAAMMAYSASVAGIDSAAITASATAAKALVQVAEAIPNSGGVAGFFAGENDMSTFATQLVPFGKALKKYAEAVVGIDAEAVKNSATAAKAIVKVAESIPNSGGVAGFFAGENDMSDFATQLVPFGKALKKYSAAVVGVDAEAVQNSVKAAKAIVKVADSIPNSGGLVSLFTGDNDISDFASKVVPFGKALKKYSEAVVGIDPSAISNSATAAKKIVSAVNNMADIDTSGVASFKKAISSLAETNIKGFVSAFSESAPKLSSMGGDMIGAIVKGAKSKQSLLKTTANASVTTFLSSIKAKYSMINSSGVSLMKQMVTGMSKMKPQIKTAATSGIASAVSAIQSHYSSFVSAGSYLGAGAVVGILSKQTAVYNAGYKLGQKSAEGFEDGEDAHSPSRRGIQAGKWLGEGGVIGILSMGKALYNAGYSIGDKATQALSSAMTKIGDVINGDMDMQPTISPVLDLSGVKTGVDAIGNLFNDKALVGVTANVDTVSSMMNQRDQNGDIVSAINKLRKDLGKVGNTTNYQVNGVTYDDGSNVSEAVKSLVRAAKIERRV